VAVGALALAVTLGIASDLLFLVAFDGRLDRLTDPALAVNGDSASADALRWAALADLFSYYLPTAVIALAVWAVLRHRAPMLATVSLVGAIGYVIAGSIGAASLAMAGPSLMRAYAQPGADQAAIGVAFGLLVTMVFQGIWQLLDGVLIATWLIGIGLLVRAEQPGFARLAWMLGFLFLVVAAFDVLDLSLAREATLGAIFALWFAWDTWLAALIWRRRSPFGAMDGSESAWTILGGARLGPDRTIVGR
jgi:hypothetical protein